MNTLQANIFFITILEIMAIMSASKEKTSTKNVEMTKKIGHSIADNNEMEIYEGVQTEQLYGNRLSRTINNRRKRKKISNMNRRYQTISRTSETAKISSIFDDTEESTFNMEYFIDDLETTSQRNLPSTRLDISQELHRRNNKANNLENLETTSYETLLSTQIDNTQKLHRKNKTTNFKSKFKRKKTSGVKQLTTTKSFLSAEYPKSNDLEETGVGNHTITEKNTFEHSTDFTDMLPTVDVNKTVASHRNVNNSNYILNKKTSQSKNSNNINLLKIQSNYLESANDYSTDTKNTSRIPNKNASNTKIFDNIYQSIPITPFAKTNQMKLAEKKETGSKHRSNLEQIPEHNKDNFNPRKTIRQRKRNYSRFNYTNNIKNSNISEKGQDINMKKVEEVYNKVENKTEVIQKFEKDNSTTNKIQLAEHEMYIKEVKNETFDSSLEINDTVKGKLSENKIFKTAVNEVKHILGRNDTFYLNEYQIQQKQLENSTTIPLEATRNTKENSEVEKVDIKHNETESTDLEQIALERNKNHESLREQIKEENTSETTYTLQEKASQQNSTTNEIKNIPYLKNTTEENIRKTSTLEKNTPPGMTLDVQKTNETETSTRANEYTQSISLKESPEVHPSTTYAPIINSTYNTSLEISSVSQQTNNIKELYTLEFTQAKIPGLDIDNNHEINRDYNEITRTSLNNIPEFTQIRAPPDSQINATSGFAHDSLITQKETTESKGKNMTDNQIQFKYSTMNKSVELNETKQLATPRMNTTLSVTPKTLQRANEIFTKIKNTEMESTDMKKDLEVNKTTSTVSQIGVTYSPTYETPRILKETNEIIQERITNSTELDTGLKKFLDMKPFNSSKEFKPVFQNNLTMNCNINRENLKYLNMSHRYLRYPYKNKLINYTSLIKLDISYNRIFRLNISALNNLATLKIIDLQYNIITELYPQYFHVLKNLEYLNLSNNNLYKIRNLTFTNLNSLTYLNLNYNNLKQINRTMFNGLCNLTQLEISNNQIETIDPNFLFYLPSLKEIKLSNNKILDLNIFNLINVKIVDLSYNQIESLNRFTINNSTSQIKILRVNNNLIRQVSENVFRNVSSLIYLDISNNKLNAILPSTFQYLYNLIYLNVSCQNILQNVKNNRGNAYIIDENQEEIKVIPKNPLTEDLMSNADYAYMIPGSALDNTPILKNSSKENRLIINKKRNKPLNSNDNLQKDKTVAKSNNKNKINDSLQIKKQGKSFSLEDDQNNSILSKNTDSKGLSRPNNFSVKNKLQLTNKEHFHFNDSYELKNKTKLEINTHRMKNNLQKTIKNQLRRTNETFAQKGSNNKNLNKEETNKIISREYKLDRNFTGIKKYKRRENKNGKLDIKNPRELFTTKKVQENSKVNNVNLDIKQKERMLLHTEMNKYLKNINEDLNQTNQVGANEFVIQTIDDSKSDIIDFKLNILTSISQKLKQFECVNIHLTQIPKILTHSIQILNLSLNKIRTIQLGDFDDYPLLQILVLSYNKINLIENDSLGRLDYLKILVLNNNKLKIIPISLPESIEILNLNRNLIIKIDSNDFIDMNRLEKLYLSFNRIQYISSNTFGHLENLKHLDISNNPIKTLNNLLFKKVNFINLSNLKLVNVNISNRFPIEDGNSLIGINLVNSSKLCQILMNDYAFILTLKQIKYLNCNMTMGNDSKIEKPVRKENEFSQIQRMSENNRKIYRSKQENEIEDNISKNINQNFKANHCTEKQNTLQTKQELTANNKRIGPKNHVYSTNQRNALKQKEKNVFSKYDYNTPKQNTRIPISKSKQAYKNNGIKRNNEFTHRKFTNFKTISNRTRTNLIQMGHKIINKRGQRTKTNISSNYTNISNGLNKPNLWTINSNSVNTSYVNNCTLCKVNEVYEHLFVFNNNDVYNLSQKIISFENVTNVYSFYEKEIQEQNGNCSRGRIITKENKTPNTKFNREPSTTPSFINEYFNLMNILRDMSLKNKSNMGLTLNRRKQKGNQIFTTAQKQDNKGISIIREDFSDRSYQNTTFNSKEWIRQIFSNKRNDFNAKNNQIKNDFNFNNMKETNDDANIKTEYNKEFTSTSLYDVEMNDAANTEKNNISLQDTNDQGKTIKNSNNKNITFNPLGFEESSKQLKENKFSIVKDNKENIVILKLNKNIYNKTDGENGMKNKHNYDQLNIRNTDIKEQDYKQMPENNFIKSRKNFTDIKTSNAQKQTEKLTEEMKMEIVNSFYGQIDKTKNIILNHMAQSNNGSRKSNKQDVDLGTKVFIKNKVSNISFVDIVNANSEDVEMQKQERDKHLKQIYGKQTAPGISETRLGNKPNVKNTKFEGSLNQSDEIIDETIMNRQTTLKHKQNNDIFGQSYKTRHDFETYSKNSKEYISKTNHSQNSSKKTSTINKLNLITTQISLLKNDNIHLHSMSNKIPNFHKDTNYEMNIVDTDAEFLDIVDEKTEKISENMIRTLETSKYHELISQNADEATQYHTGIIIFLLIIMVMIVIAFLTLTVRWNNLLPYYCGRYVSYRNSIHSDEDDDEDNSDSHLDRIEMMSNVDVYSIT